MIDFGVYCCLLTTILPALCDASEVDSSVDQPPYRSFCRGSSADAGDAVKLMIEGASAEKLRLLTLDKDPSVAIFARWKLLRNRPNLGIYDVQRFLGTVEGRTRLAIPLRWEISVLLADSYDNRPLNLAVWENYRKRVDYLRYRRGLVTFAKRRLKGNKEGIHTHPGTVIYRNDKHIIFKVGDDHKIRTNEDTILSLFSGERHRLYCSVLVRETHTYIAIYDDFERKFPLFCIESNSGRLLWKTESWSLRNDDLPIRAGSWYQEVSIVASQERVGLFGKGIHGHFLEVFDCNTGKCLTRFCTNFWQ